MEHQRNDHNHLSIFVDTDAFVAVAVQNDASHDKALSLLHTLLAKNVVFYTSNYVFSESITVISQRDSHEAAIRYIETMTSPQNPFQIRRADEALEEEAIQLFKAQTSKNTSYVDCTNMAFLHYLHADAIFSFDEDYRKNGFILAQDWISEAQAA